MQWRDADDGCVISIEELQYCHGRRLERKRLSEKRRVYESVESGMDMWRNKNVSGNTDAKCDGK